MLRPSSVRDASTCLRCNLRLVLRRIQQCRYQSSDESPLALGDGVFPAPAPAPAPAQQPVEQASAQRVEQASAQSVKQPTRLRVVRTHANHGKIRGKKGGQRRVESSEPLSISSLGQSSEVIVLRDLHEPKPSKKPLQEQPDTRDADSPDPKPRALTAREIEAMSGRSGVRPPPSEVFESIEALRPDEGVHVVTKAEFDAKVTALTKGYNTHQLRGYLYQITAPAQVAPSDATESRRAHSARNKIDTTEISSTHGELQDLKRTPWHPGVTAAANRLPMTRSLTDRQLPKGRKTNNKEHVVESILREGWALGIEEEEAAAGEMEFLLSPMQFGLLLSKNSETLRPLLESNKFYKNSRFQLYQADHVIRIIGPRAEAEAIAYVLADAYAPARSAEINLDTFHAVLQDKPAGYRLHDIFNPTQLSNIMDLTRTYIRYDAEAHRLQIASFVDVAINDAHRLLVALLPLRMRGKTTLLHEPHAADDCRLEPISTPKNLPSHARHRSLGRWVTSSPKAPKTGKQVVADPVADSIADSPIIAQALQVMKRPPPRTELPTSSTQPSIWPSKSRADFWEARIGQALHDTQLQDTYPGAAGNVSSSAYKRTEHIFAPRFPGLVGILAHARPLLTNNDLCWEDRTELIAHLIPSPLETAGILATSAFPSIQLRFSIESATPQEPQPPSADSEERDDLKGCDDSKNPDASKEPPVTISTILPNGKRVVFRDMRAIVQSETVQLCLPSYPVDICFERRQSLVSRYAAKDARIRSFVEAIHESMVNDTALRAPPALQIPVPQWIIRSIDYTYPEKLQQAERSIEAQARSKQALKNKVVPVKYLFAGFEYREPRDFELSAVGMHHRVRLATIEAGMTGGRRLELSLLLKQLIMDNIRAGRQKMNLEALVDASVRMVNYLAKGEQVNHYNLSQNLESSPDKERGFRRPKLDSVQAQDSGGMSNSSSRAGKETYAPPSAGEWVFGKQTQDILEESIPQTQNTDPNELPEVDKVAQQDGGPKMESDHNARVEEVSSDEPTSLEPAVATEEAEQHPPSKLDTEQDSQTDDGMSSQTAAPSHTIDNSTEQDQTPISSTLETTSEMETSSPSSSSEPETEVENKTEEKKPEEEEEPLRLRLRRLMSGGV